MPAIRKFSTALEAVDALAQAKAVEEQARDERVLLEDVVAEMLGFNAPEGSKTYPLDVDGVGQGKVTLKRNVYTSVSSEGWLALRRKLPQNHPGRAIFRQKFDIDTKKARALQVDYPKAWAQVSPVIARKPGKVSVEIKELRMLPREGS